MAESSTITREPEISARDVAAIPPDDVLAIQQALQRAFAAEDVAAKNIALKRASESIGLLSGYAPFPCEALMEGSYSSVFRLIRESLEAGAPGLAAATKDALARSGALKVAARKLAPAAYGDKRQPYHTHAMAGVEGMCATLHLRDGSLELVFKDEELDLINEEGRDLYVARIAASEVIHLRQWLIDFLPASETEIRPVEVVPALDAVAVPAPGSEERLFWLEAAEQHDFGLGNDGIYTATSLNVLTLMAAAREQGRKDVLDAFTPITAPTVSGSGSVSEAARDVIAENAGCRRPAEACGAGGTGAGNCGCMLTADAVLLMADPVTGEAP